MYIYIYVYMSICTCIYIETHCLSLPGMYHSPLFQNTLSSMPTAPEPRLTSFTAPPSTATWATGASRTNWGTIRR